MVGEIGVATPGPHEAPEGGVEEADEELYEELEALKSVLEIEDD
jgi:hypothetical protein